MAVFGAGAFVHFSGPRGSLDWLLVVRFAAWIGQQFGAQLTSDALGGFFGGFVVVPVGAWVATRRSGPPTLATFLVLRWQTYREAAAKHRRAED